jgi:hypothetical protein
MPALGAGARESVRVRIPPPAQGFAQLCTPVALNAWRNHPLDDFGRGSYPPCRESNTRASAALPRPNTIDLFV